MELISFSDGSKSKDEITNLISEKLGIDLSYVDHVLVELIDKGVIFL